MKINKVQEKISRLKKSKNGKTVAANVGYLSLLQVAGYLFPLITTPYLARTIGADGFGRIAFASAIIVWIQTIVDWGFNFSATRDVAQNRDDKNKVSDIFSNVFWARLSLTLISGLFLAILVFLVPYLRENAAIIFVCYLGVPGHVLFPDWFFQGIERMKYTTYFNLTIKFIFTILVFAVIKDKNDYIYQPLLSTIGFLVCGIISLFLIVYKWGYRIKRPNFHSIINTIKASTDVFINNLFPNFYSSFSVLLLGFFGCPADNGIFSAGSKFVTIARNFQHILSRAFFPFLSRREDKHTMFAKINISVGIFLTASLFIGAPLIIKVFFTEEFIDSITVLRILSLSFIGLALNNTYGTNFLIAQHYEKELRKITVRTSLIAFVISIPLVYYYSYIGAALALTFTRCLLGCQSYIKVKNIKKKNNS